MTTLECAICYLAARDLPDDVDPEMFFETDDGVTHCPTCDPRLADVEGEGFTW